MFGENLSVRSVIDMSDESKVTEESVKTIGKGIDLVDKVGGFIAPLIKGSLQEG